MAYKIAKSLGLTVFEVPKTVLIEDANLGLAKATLQVALLVGFILLAVFNSQEMMHVEIPTAEISYFGLISPIDLRTAHAYPYTYCNNPSMSYGDQLCSEANPEGITGAATSSDPTCTDASTCDGIFCELDIGCADLQFNEMNVKGEGIMSFPTLIKDQMIETGPCGNGPGVISQDECEGQGYRYFFTNFGNGKCECRRLHNMFVKGVEEISMNFDHVWGGLKEIDYSLHSSRSDRKGIKTIIYDKNGKVVKTIKSGAVSGKLSWWLDVAGIDLDAQNTAAAAGRSPMSGFADAPTFRTTGLKILVTLDYRGPELGSVGSTSVGPGEDGITCHATVQWAEGTFESFGSKVWYTGSSTHNNSMILDYTDFASDGSVVSSVIHDQYPRGVKFDFTVTGAVGEVRPLPVLEFIASFLVYFSLSTVLLSVVAFYLLGYRSEVYKNAARGGLTIEGVHAKIAAQAIAAMTSFNVITGGGSGEAERGKITEKMLFEHSAPHLGDLKAFELASTAMKLPDTEGHPRRDSMSVEEWLDLTTDDNIDIKGMLAFLKSKVGPVPNKFKTKVAPHPSGTLHVQPAPQAPQTVMLRVPEGASVGALVQFTLPNGVTKQVTIPSGKSPGDLIPVDL